MKAARILALFALSLFIVCARAQSNDYPPLDAIRLVVGEELQLLKQLDAGDWSMDTKVREWSVQRTVHPGVLDSTRLLNVLYRIDGRVVACWLVDTGTKRVQRLARCGP